MTENQETGTQEQQETKKTYKCPLCKDTFLRDGGFDKDGNHFVIPCECAKARQAEQRIKASGLEREIKTKTFRSFRAETPWQEEMKDKAIAYGRAYFKAKEEGNTLPWFFIAGQPGCGKSHLCTALCGGLLKKNVAVVYMQWVTESRRLRAVVNEPDFDNIIYPFTDVEVLYIDDLFKQRGRQNIEVSNAEARVLFEILNTRYIQNKATIISTEWYLETDLMGVDDGTFSRVYERAKGFTVSVERSQEKNYRINPAMGAYQA